MEHKILSGDQIAYQDQTLKLMKGAESFPEEILHVFNTTDSFGRISKSASSAVEGFFSFSYFNYDINDKLPRASHIHYEKFLGRPYFSSKEMNQLMDVEDLIKSLGISRKEFYTEHLHSQTRSQVSYLDKTTTAKAIEGKIYETLIDSSVFKQFSRGVIKNLFEIAPDENKEALKNHIKDIESLIMNSESLLAFNKGFVEHFLDGKVVLTDSFEQFDVGKGESYTALSGWLDRYDIYRDAYNEAVKGSSLKVLKEGDLPYFCVNINTKARGEVSYDPVKNEIVLYGDKNIPYTTMEELLLRLRSCNSIIVPKALMLSYQKLLQGNIILPKKGSEYVFLLHTFYRHLQRSGIAPEMHKLLMVEFDFFKELGNLSTLRIPSKLAELLGLMTGDGTMALSKESYQEVGGHAFYESYTRKYDEANQMLSAIKENKENIPKQMRIIGFDQVEEYESLKVAAEEILQNIRSRSINGKVDPGLLQEKNMISREISNIKKTFYSCLLQTVMECKYIAKLDKNSFRPYILRLLAINPDLINNLVSNAKIAIFDVAENRYQDET